MILRQTVIYNPQIGQKLLYEKDIHTIIVTHGLLFLPEYIFKRP
jgi:hypothetical protein